MNCTTRHATRRIAVCLAASICVHVVAAPAQAQQDLSRTLSFAALGPDGFPGGWSAHSPGVTFADSIVTRSAPYAARLHVAEGASGPAIITLVVPITFAGRFVEVRGWLKTENVQQFAGLWLREDGPSGTLQFDNMQHQALKGTTDWTSYSIRLPLHPNARALYVGALLVGSGTTWVDDIEVLVDGKPLSEAPPRAASSSAVDADNEFDAGSRIRFARQPLTRVQVSNLALFGKVWGFAKYHHPRITAGQLNWDNELFRVMPSVIAARDRAAALDVLSAWLEKAGEPAACSPCAVPPADAHLQPDLAWIRDASITGARLGALLQQIHAARPAEPKQYYIGMMPGTGNADLSNEDAYASMTEPDAGYRMLALFRFWNIIEYWFPYRDVIGEEWDDVLADFVPVVMNAESGDAYRIAMMKLSARINDTHANVWASLALRPPTGQALLPVRVRFVGGKAVVTDYFHDTLGPATGLQRGDIIERIGGAPVDSLVNVWRPWYSASNEPTRLRDVARALTRGAEGPVTLSILRDGRRTAVTANRVAATTLDRRRSSVQDLPGETFRMLSDDVAYLKLSSVRNADMASYITRAANAKVLVVDIRNYPSEFVPFTLGPKLITQRTEFAIFTRPDLTNPGAFTWTQPMVMLPQTPGFAGKVVVLVDETSQSQAEYTSMALRASPNAIVVGSTTAGADGNVSEIPLPGGVESMMSGLGVFYPDRRPTQRIGIVPDLFVEPTIAGIKAGRDEVLEAGVSRALGRPFVLRLQPVQ